MWVGRYDYYQNFCYDAIIFHATGKIMFCVFNYGGFISHFLLRTNNLPKENFLVCTWESPKCLLQNQKKNYYKVVYTFQKLYKILLLIRNHVLKVQMPTTNTCMNWTDEQVVDCRRQLHQIDTDEIARNSTFYVHLLHFIK